MATRRVGGGGRLRIGVLLLAFLVISGGVILRRTFGIAAERDLLDLDARRAALVAERLRLEGEIRSAGSRARLQMRVPSDSQVVIIPRSSHDTP